MSQSGVRMLAQGSAQRMNAPATFQAVMNKLISQNKYNAVGTKNPVHILSEFSANVHR